MAWSQRIEPCSLLSDYSTWYGMVWYGMAWDAMVWYGICKVCYSISMVWYGMVLVHINFITTYDPVPWLNQLLAPPVCWDLLSQAWETELSLLPSALYHGLHPPFSMPFQFPNQPNQKNICKNKFNKNTTKLVKQSIQRVPEKIM